jgi:restriction system protein
MFLMVNKARTPWFPTYSSARLLYPLLVGVRVSEYRSMNEAIGKQMGTNEHPVDWTKPDEWIQERLVGSDQRLAKRIWEESGHVLNPRHLGGQEFLARNYRLLDFSLHQLELTPDGEAFLADDVRLIRRLDDDEGLIALLGILSGLGSAQRKQILPEWMAFLTQNSATKAESAGSSKLYDRLVNLLDRNLLVREGLKYIVTTDGQAYLGEVEPPQIRRQVSTKREMYQAVSTYVQEQRKEMRDLLGKMHPYRFEHLIMQLLTAMKYENAEVTQQSGDKGVDVVATARFGITTVREVIQVKRVQGNIQRPVLDQLRGVLPLHHAIRGTIITLGKFSAGLLDAAVFPGAAPITLIDGDALLDLLIENGVGVTPITLPVQPFSVNAAFFSEQAPTPDEEAASA